MIIKDHSISLSSQTGFIEEDSYKTKIRKRIHLL